MSSPEGPIPWQEPGSPALGNAEGCPVLNGDDIRQAFDAASRCLERQREAINALNVFPVPDGDTGTNMLLTMRSVIEESQGAPGSQVSAVLAAMARGALLGARGNSGVILSQFFRGLAQGLEGKEHLTGEDLGRAFELASAAADRSVSVPVDGTMLTVIRELSRAVSRYLEGPPGSRDPLSVWVCALEAARLALSRTPLQLPVLREAGVVDAGGQGLVTLLEGACCHLSGENVEYLELHVCEPIFAEAGSIGAQTVGVPGGSEGLPSVHEDYLTSTEEELYGYCTQLLIQGRGLDTDRIREELSAMADSTVVVGDEDLVKLHVHARDPGPVISYAVSLGDIDQVSVTNMDQQHQDFLAHHRGSGDTASTPAEVTGPETTPRVTKDADNASQASMAVVAVAWGEGFDQLFKGLGCGSVLVGGQTMNPSTRELLDVARQTGTGQVILLPNNANILPAARQASAIANGDSGQRTATAKGSLGIKLHVVPSRTIPQGVAALLAFNPEGDLDTNLKSMETALATVKTIEVTTAVRTATIGGLAVKEGHFIGLVEGEPVAVGESPLSALQQAFTWVGPVAGQLATLYWGSPVQEGQAREAAALLRESMPSVDVEVVHGGQPFYHYIASLE